MLVKYEVDFIVVGGIAAALRGAPMSTFDLDLLHSRSPANLDRLLKALGSLEAYYRFQAEKRLKPGRSHLSSAGHQLLATRFGPLDLLGTIGKGHSYEDLLPDSKEMKIAPGLGVRVLTLEKLIQTKEETADEKDKAALPLLRRALEEQRRARKPMPGGGRQ